MQPGSRSSTTGEPRTRPIINTAMVGAFARRMDIPPLDTIAEAIKAGIAPKPDDNVQVSREAYEQVDSPETAKHFNIYQKE